MKSLPVGLCLLVAGWNLSACLRKSAPAKPVTPEVLVTTVAPRDVPVIKEGVATLNGFINASISARVSGYVISQDYEQGSVVKKGDLLFQIDPRPFEEALAQAEANLARVQATQRKGDADEKRALELFDKKVTSAQERDTALQAAGVALADTKAGEAAVKQAKLNLEYTRIIAPIDGVAGFANAQVGDLVSPTSEPLTTVSQLEPIKAVVSAGEQAFTDFVTKHPDAEERDSYLKTLEFELLLGNGSTYAHKGKFHAVDRNLDPKTGAIRFELTFPNPGNILRPGQFGRVRVTVETRKGALVVPQEAVVELQGNYHVAIVDENNKLATRQTKMGERFGALWEVTDGLKPGDKVIVQGGQKVRPGSAVTVKAWTQPPEQTVSVNPSQGKDR
jgi:membrane fusion protein (multidrug efflux system)